MNRHITNLLIGSTIFAYASLVARADVCLENPFGGPTVCVGWHLQDEPIEDLDFRIDYITNPVAPDVELLSGAQWRVWSVDAANSSIPGDMGDVSATQPQNYDVLLRRADGTPAARNVGNIILNPTGNFYSSISEGSRIAGNLTGDLLVKRQSSFPFSGGLIRGLTIDGEAQGNITAYSIFKLTVVGNYSGSVIRCNKLFGVAAQPGATCDGTSGREFKSITTCAVRSTFAR